MLSSILLLALLDTATRAYSLVITWDLRSMAGKTHQYNDMFALTKTIGFGQGFAMVLCMLTATVFAVWVYPNLLVEVWPLQPGNMWVTYVMAGLVTLGLLDALQGVIGIVRRMFKKPETIKAAPFWHLLLKQGLFALQPLYLWYLIAVL